LNLLDEDETLDLSSILKFFFEVFELRLKKFLGKKDVFLRQINQLINRLESNRRQHYFQHNQRKPLFY